MRESTISRKGFFAFIGTAIAAVALSLAFAPNAFAATMTGYDLYTYYNGTGDTDQHVVLELQYDGAVSVAQDAAILGDNFDISIAGNSIASDNYHRNVTATADGNTLKLDVGSVMTQDEYGEWTVPGFTAIYGGVISVWGSPAGVTVDGTTPEPLSIYTVIPTGVHISMTDGEGSNSLTAVVDEVANARGMVHVAIYNTANGSWVPVNVNTAGGNLGVGAYTTHAHSFFSMDEAALASGMGSFALPEGYSISVSGATINVTGPEGAQLHMYVFDDDFLQAQGLTFNGVVSNEGVMEGYLPGEN